ncbi:prepilin-type N-terminal cleavage/methylation domain-containing protein [bacterium]|nr:prepilin-type N-terminal cleavage/methylation domain-containing protein [bacterium]
MKKFGFTLAEVLITVGIIGVVSALTLPTLVKNYRNEVLAKSLIAAISDFEVAMQMLIMKDGVNNLWETEAWDKIPGDGLNATSTDNVIIDFEENIGRIIRLEDSGASSNFYTSIRNLDGANLVVENIVKNTRAFRSKNNVIYHISISNADRTYVPVPSEDRNKTSLYQLAAFVMIDTNSAEPPNMLGRDIFEYYLGIDGKLYPRQSREACLYNSSDIGPGDPISTYENPEPRCKANKGEYCGAYLQENGYKIDY